MTTYELLRLFRLGVACNAGSKRNSLHLGAYIGVFYIDGASVVKVRGFEGNYMVTGESLRHSSFLLHSLWRLVYLSFQTRNGWVFCERSGVSLSQLERLCLFYHYFMSIADHRQAVKR
jgi:hypothetical protein